MPFMVVVVINKGFIRHFPSFSIGINIILMYYMLNQVKQWTIS